MSDNSSDDLPPPDQLNFGTSLARRPTAATDHFRPLASTSTLGSTSTSLAPPPRSHSTASEHRPSALGTATSAATVAASKGKSQASAASLEVLGDSDSGSETDGGGEADPYDAMLARKRKKGVAVAVARGVSDSALIMGGPPLKKKVSLELPDSPLSMADLEFPFRQASTASASTTTSTSTAKTSAAAARTATAQAKLDAAAYAKAHRSANTLQSDRKKTVAELTCHVDGLGLRAPVTPTAAGDPPAAHGEVAFSVPLKRGQKAKASVWGEVAGGLRERMGPYSCGVEVGAEEGKRRGHDLRSEGAVRWTRVCDRRWDDRTTQFVPLGKGNEVVVEEDSRLIFM